MIKLIAIYVRMGLLTYRVIWLTFIERARIGETLSSHVRVGNWFPPERMMAQLTSKIGRADLAAQIFYQLSKKFNSLRPDQPWSVLLYHPSRQQYPQSQGSCPNDSHLVTSIAVTIYFCKNDIKILAARNVGTAFLQCHPRSSFAGIIFQCWQLKSQQYRSINWLSLEYNSVTQVCSFPCFHEGNKTTALFTATDFSRQNGHDLPLEIIAQEVFDLSVMYGSKEADDVRDFPDKRIVTYTAR